MYLVKNHLPRKIVISTGSSIILNTIYRCMKWCERHCGRGFDSRHLHQRVFWPVLCGGGVKVSTEW